ncbi:hypothetical protein GCM10023189_44640 [Nibrella saemangeumensis]|uniref:Uncharacterized protein n=1 Tax=Nibrella saemangeumensis TaxID=1084526 RepID=A0ABP8NC76_9BACT
MLFSQYTWGDFFKVAFGLAVPYYSYVAWAYFREDIREFIREKGRGGAKLATAGSGSTAAAGEEEDPDDDSFYVVRRYTDAAATSGSAAVAAPAETMAVVDESARSVEVDSQVQAVEEEEAPVLAATPIVAGDALPESMMFGLVGAEEAIEEQSVTELVDSAKHLQREEDGMIVAGEASSPQARSLAEVINSQGGQKPKGLTGIHFGR